MEVVEESPTGSFVRQLFEDIKDVNINVSQGDKII